MIAGTLVLEDTTLTFVHNSNDYTVSYTVSDNLINKSEKLIVNDRDFFCALAIAVHFEGEPNAEKDYDSALKAMPTNMQLRWIP